MLKRTDIASSSVGPHLNVQHAGWVSRVLGMLIAVVGKDSLLGLVLGQTRQEIHSLVQAAEQGTLPTDHTWYLNN